MRLPALVVVAIACCATPAANAQVDTAFAREVHAEVEKGLDRMQVVSFTARRPRVQFTSEVRAWSDAGGVRKVRTVDRDDSGDVVTEYYFKGGALVFAYEAILGAGAAGKPVTRVEHRQYFREGRMVRWLGGLEKADLAKDPEFARAGRERLAAAAFFRDGARAVRGKPLVATLVNATSGDTSCLLQLRDERGATMDEPADFELCEEPRRFAGRRVSLSWGFANVLAASCQGDVDCGKSDRIALVTAMAPVAAAGAAALPPAPRSWCTSGEEVVFACRAGPKLASVCASKDASRAAGYLEYRFGRPGSREPVEIAVPESRRVPSRAATGENVAFAGGGGSWLRFRQGEYGYVAYSGIGRWGPKGEALSKQGVVVERGGKAVALVTCEERIEDLPARDWYERLGIGTGGGDFDFPG